MKLKKNDQVLILSGKDKGKKGKILSVFPEKEKLMVEGVNIMKKHVRPKKSGEKGQIVEIPALIDISNAKIICPKCDKATRIGCKVVENKRFRICKKCEAEI